MVHIDFSELVHSDFGYDLKILTSSEFSNWKKSSLLLNNSAQVAIFNGSKRLDRALRIILLCRVIPKYYVSWMDDLL